MTNHPHRTQVITWVSSDAVSSIDLTVSQERELRRAGVWPKDQRGHEYCCVSHGLHSGAPTFSADAFEALIDRLTS